MTEVIVLLAGASLSLLVYVLALREDIADLQKSKDDLRESMSNTNYDLHQQLERVKKENEALRTQLHQLRKESNTQSNG